MSTIVAQTLSNGTVSTSTANCIRGSARAWVNFDGLNSPYSIRASYNVSSITRNATGYYTINMTNALPDVNYSVTGSSAVSAGNLTGITVFTGTSSATYVAGTTTSFNIAVSNYTVAILDSPAISISVFD
jgi:hypothetical protein